MKQLIPSTQTIKTSIVFAFQVLAGGMLLIPLTKRLPMIGWDWYWFFTEHSVSFNLSSPQSAYPPFTFYLLRPLINKADWRGSLILLYGITLMTIALATKRNHGGYGSIVLALLSPPVWYLLWVGHPDGLVLFGLVSGFIPLALIKPQLTIWSLFSSQRALFWTTIFLLATLLVWSMWPLRLGQATFFHPAAFGWVVTGIPVLICGFILLIGAGNDIYKLMCAGVLLSPHLLPYNLAVLVPILGQVQGYRKAIVYATTWLTFLGVGLSGEWKFLSFIFPVTAYICAHSWGGYVQNLNTLMQQVASVFGYVTSRRPFGTGGRKG